MVTPGRGCRASVAPPDFKPWRGQARSGRAARIQIGGDPARLAGAWPLPTPYSMISSPSSSPSVACKRWRRSKAGTSDGGWASLRARLNAGEPLAALATAAGGPLATSALQPWSHWVTAVGLPKRFDTLFFVARAAAGQVPQVHAGETTALAWVHPPAQAGYHEAGSAH